MPMLIFRAWAEFLRQLIASRNLFISRNHITNMGNGSASEITESCFTLEYQSIMKIIPNLNMNRYLLFKTGT